MRLRTHTVTGLLIVTSLVVGTQACRDPAAPVRSAIEASHAADAGRPRTATADPAALLKALDPADLCAMAPARRIALPQAKPFTAPEPQCVSDPFCDSVDVPPPGTDACFVANQNLRRAERDSAASKPRSTASTPWNGAAPKYLDRIDAHYHLTQDEHAKLSANGFVVLDRLHYESYAAAFHDVFQEQLPLYVAMDPVYHAVYRGTELVLASIERRELRPAMHRLLRDLRTGLRTGHYSAEIMADLGTYLGVAAELADENPSHPHTFELANAAELAEGLTEVELFGRPRMIDFSQFAPRGHYEGDGGDYRNALASYFRAMQWLSRVEFNLVSRGCQSSHAGDAECSAETPREARAAMALAEIARRSGAERDLRRFEEVYTTFAGAREDVSPTALRDLMHTAGITATDPNAPAALKAAIGPGFARTVATQFHAEGQGPLPVIASLIGQRIVPDTAPLASLVHDQIEDRKAMSPGGEIGYLLGHDAARGTLSSDLAAFPALLPALDAGRQALRTKTDAANNVYGTWLRSILALGAPPQGTVPSFYAKPAFASRRMESALVAYGQLRHTFVLLAAQGYDAYGCEIPDAYVEPEVAALDRLAEHVAKLRSLAGPRSYAGLTRSLAMLRRIAAREITGAELPEADRRWLGMVSEYIPTGGYAGDSGAPPKWTGWYYDMFEDREHSALETAAFVADYFTMTNNGTSENLGAEGPRLGVFVVDVGGVPRAMVGPVAKGYAASVPLATGRASDKAPPAPELRRAPWRASYAATAALRTPGDLAFVTTSCGDETPTYRVALAAREDVGDVRVELLDHHGDPLGVSLTLPVGREPTVAAFNLPGAFERATEDDGPVGSRFAISSQLDVAGVHVTVVNANAHLRQGPSTMAMGDAAD